MPPVARSFLRVTDLSSEELRLVIDRALAYKKAPQRSPDLLRGQSVTLYFNKPSTRTRISFETAVHRLGGLPVTVGPNDLQMGRGETVEDTARVISRYSAAFVTRTYADDEITRFAKAASIPVINALTDGHHPCQALADLLTLRERFGKLEGLTLAYVGAGNNVVHSLLEASALAGMNMRVAAPSRYPADPVIVEGAKRLAEKTGSRIEITESAAEAVDGVDAVYTDTWLSMGDPFEERKQREQVLAPYQVNAALMKRAKPTAVFLHCLPAHRDEEVTNEVADSDQSVIFDQAENKLHTSMAILDVLVSGAI
ncbi:MAG: ornithine carbamoyltransferase [Myxococcales bacterium]|nr:ornithine carbamoyltransferase [Myxococcales bacterium]